MKNLLASACVAFIAVTTAAFAFVTPQQSDSSRAQVAYADLVGRFWYGDSATGRFYRNAYAPHSMLDSSVGTDPPVCKGCLWEYAMGINVLFAQWKIAGSSDALARLMAEWRFVKATWSLSDMGTCGNVAGSTSGAQDDAAWGSNGMLQLYEATNDPVALTYAKAILDCAWTRWYDTTTGGGLWYDDTFMTSLSTAKKSSYQAPYAWALLTYSIDAGDTTYQAKAVSLDTWASTALTVGRSDGLYWEGIHNDGTAFGAGSPYGVKASTSIFLAGEMSWAALDAKLYALTGNAAYRTRALATAAGIYAHERVGLAFMDDRDAFTNGWSAYYYAVNVVPLLPSSGAADASTYLATARAVGNFGRSIEGTYSGDWDGTSVSWSASPAFNLKVSANAVIWPVVALMFAH